MFVFLFLWGNITAIKFNSPLALTVLLNFLYLFIFLQILVCLVLVYYKSVEEFLVMNKLLCLFSRGVCSALSHVPACNFLTEPWHREVSLKHQSLKCKNTWSTVIIFLFPLIRRNRTKLKRKRLWQGKNTKYFHTLITPLTTKLFLPFFLRKG